MSKVRETGVVATQQIRAVRPVRIGVIGLGTVGTGTVKVLLEHQRELERRLGCKLDLRVICSRTIDQKDLAWIKPSVQRTANWRDVVDDPEVDIVISLVGKLESEYAIAQATLQNSKHLVTANKQLVAEHGVELVLMSHKSGVSLGIEACVAGGMPILHAIREGLAGEH